MITKKAVPKRNGFFNYRKCLQPLNLFAISVKNLTSEAFILYKYFRRTSMALSRSLFLAFWEGIKKSPIETPRMPARSSREAREGACWPLSRPLIWWTLRLHFSAKFSWVRPLDLRSAFSCCPIALFSSIFKPFLVALV